MSDRIYLMGIGGIGMANLAVLLKESGVDVSGSDDHVYDPAATILSRAGIRFRTPYQESNLPGVDCPVVVGNAMSRGHVEVEAALRRGHRLLSFPETLGQRVLAGRRTIVVAGTHGKSSVSACLAHILRVNGHDPGYLIGGQALDLDSGAALGTGPAFVVEGDEYDCAFFDKRSKFLHYFPRTLVLGRIEFDHADVFASLDEILTSFRRLVNLLPDNGLLVYFGDCENARAIAAHAPCRAVSVGESASCDWQLLPDVARLTLRSSSGDEESTMLQTPGRHNRLNTLMAVACAAEMGDELTHCLVAASSFRGIRRRLETLFADDRIIVYDDFAHHPTAVRAAIHAVREAHPDRRIIAVFEPRSNTSVRRIFQNEFADALADADQALIGSIHRESRIPKEDRLDRAELVQTLSARGTDAMALANPDIIDYLTHQVSLDRSVLLFMSNGSFNGIPQEFAVRVSNRR